MHPLKVFVTVSAAVFAGFFGFVLGMIGATAAGRLDPFAVYSGGAVAGLAGAALAAFAAQRLTRATARGPDLVFAVAFGVLALFSLLVLVQIVAR